MVGDLPVVVARWAATSAKLHSLAVKHIRATALLLRRATELAAPISRWIDGVGVNVDPANPLQHLAMTREKGARVYGSGYRFAS